LSDLLRLALDAHGGIDRWNRLTRIDARVTIGGTMWGRKGQDGVIADSRVILDPHRQRITYTPFGAPGRHSEFEPDRIKITTDDGRVLAERRDPRVAFAGHTQDTPWDELHAVYFSGYALWNYLTIPFLFTRPGFAVEEVAPWRQDGQTWRRLAVRFADDIATHNPTQTFYFDESGLLRRHDYAPEVFGGRAVAHFTDEHRTFGGFSFPTRRRAVLRLPDGHIRPERTVVTIDVLDVTVH
jgi:hypothetical protein